MDFSTAEKSTRPAFEQILLEIPMEERMLCVCVGQSKVPDQAKSSTPQRSLCSHGSGALIGIHFTHKRPAGNAHEGADGVRMCGAKEKYMVDKKNVA